MIAGFRYQIELLARNAVADEAGGFSVAYAPVTAIWAGVDELPAVSVGDGGRTRKARRIKALIRSRNDTPIGARIRFDGVDYDVVSIESDDERGRRVFLICEEARQ